MLASNPFYSGSRSEEGRDREREYGEDARTTGRWAQGTLNVKDGGHKGPVGAECGLQARTRATSITGRSWGGLVAGCGRDAPLLQLSTLSTYCNRTVGFLIRILDPGDSLFSVNDFSLCIPAAFFVPCVYALEWLKGSSTLAEVVVCHIGLFREWGYPETAGSSGETLVYLFSL